MPYGIVKYYGRASINLQNMKNHERIIDIYSTIRRLKHEYKILEDRRQWWLPWIESISTQHLKRLVQIDRELSLLYKEFRTYLTWTERLFKTRHSIFMEASDIYIKEIDKQIQETKERTRKLKLSKK